MLDILNQQFQSGKAFTEARHYSVLQRAHYPSYYHDLHPLNPDYYHEFNPQFTFNLPRPEFFSFAKTFTVRDGRLSFAAFVLKNLQTIPKLNTHFLIHPELASIVPDFLTEHFSLWQLSQNKKVPISNAKKVILFGVLCEQYLCSLDEMELRLRPLLSLRDEVEIEVYLPTRKNPFDQSVKESLLPLLVMDLIRKTLGNRRLTFCDSNRFFQRTDFKNNYLIDLARDRFLVSDNYVHYFVASRGGTVENIESEFPRESIFDLDLSFDHKLHITPFKQSDSIFLDLLYYKKQHPTRDILFDPMFHRLLKEKDPQFSPPT